MAATEGGHAHVITDGLVGREQKMLPLLGFLCKSRREAEFPTEILMRLGYEYVDVWAVVIFMVVEGDMHQEKSGTEMACFSCSATFLDCFLLDMQCAMCKVCTFAVVLQHALLR